MNVNDKIKQILIDKSLSPSVFADEIGVQRSSISHILSGRNRPSFDIIQKVIRRYPDLGYDWIMEDDNQEIQYTTKLTSVQSSRETAQSSRLKESPLPTQQRQHSTTNPVPSQPATADQLLPITATGKAVERILLFYTDGTFREYKPTS